MPRPADKFDELKASEAKASERADREWSAFKAHERDCLQCLRYWAAKATSPCNEGAAKHREAKLAVEELRRAREARERYARTGVEVALSTPVSRKS